MMHLNQLVSDALDEAGDDIDFDAVADKVAVSIPSDEIDQTLRLLLRSYVANYAGRVRRRLLDPGMPELTEAILDACDDQPAPRPGLSRRLAYAPVWLKVLDSIVVIDEGQVAKRLRKCDEEDLSKIVDGMSRREHELRNRRLQYEFLLARLRASKNARFVEDLPEDVIETFVKGGKP